MASLEKFWRKQDILLYPAVNIARDPNGESYRLIKVPKYKHDQYAVFGSYNASYRHGHISEDSGIPTRSSYGNNKIMAGNYNGDWQGAGKEMMHFAFDRHAGRI